MKHPANMLCELRRFHSVLRAARNVLLAVFAATALHAFAAGIPVVYCTDLFHPHDDPDDHFDLATLFALPELDVKAILLDQGNRQLKTPGAIPLRQMARMTGREVPFAIGLGEKLKSPTDDGRTQPPQFQAAIDLLLKTLREASEPVTVIGTGSVRDLCAAWNREPELLKQKVARFYLNIGNAASSQREYNVDLDQQAYVGLLRSGLPLYLCFCLPMEQGNTNAVYSTWWRFRHSEVLPSAPKALQNYFIYALQKPAAEELDPIKALDMDMRPWHRLIWEMDRNMWCTAPLLQAARRDVHKTSTGWMASRESAADVNTSTLFTFVPIRIEVDETGRTKWKPDDANPNAHLFKVFAPQNYGPAMRDCLRELLRSFPLEPSLR